MQFPDKLIEYFSTRLKSNVDTTDKSWIKTRGFCKYFVEIESREDLEVLFEFKSQIEVPFFFLGRGSNVLFPEKPLEALVIRLKSDQKDFRVNEDVLELGASVFMPYAIQISHKLGLYGFEFAAGIPGTVGGGVVMNAGTKVGEISDVIEYVDVFTENGLKRLKKEELGLSYRKSKLPEGMIWRAGFRMASGNRQDIEDKKQEVKEYLNFRNNSQPISQPTLGSTFKNPEGHFAGKLIEEAGLKGLRRGGMGMSEKHANFLINYGSGTGDEARALITEVIEKVEANSGVTMRPEIRIL